MDQAKNFAKATIDADFEESDTVLTVAAAHGLRFPTPPFNGVLYNSTDYPDPADDPSVEIVRVTGIDGDDLDVLRAQEGTDARAIIAGKTFLLVAGLTAKVINEDLQLGIIADLANGTIQATQDGAGWSIDRDSGTTKIGDVADSFNGTIVQVDDDNQQVTITRQLITPNLPSSDPLIAGALYYDALTGIVKRSNG